MDVVELGEFLRFFYHMTALLLCLLNYSAGLPLASLNGSVYSAKISGMCCLSSKQKPTVHCRLCHLNHSIQSHRFNSLVGVGPSDKWITIPTGHLKKSSKRQGLLDR